MPGILIIEDDPTIIEELADTLKFHDYRVFTAGDGQAGLRLFTIHRPDLVILDIMLPGPDGFTICRKLKEMDPEIPVIMLTAKDQESDKLLGFELGADDYVTKPFSIKVLLARIKAVLKRSAGSGMKDELVTIGPAKINLKSYTITRRGTEHPLSPKEAQILGLLLAHPGEVIDRDRIIDEVWGDEYFPSPRTIDNFILKLRTKIEEDPKAPRHIMTVHGAGYKFKE